MIRVTQGMMNHSFIRNLNVNNDRMQQYQDMLASGKKLNKPSDDPIGVVYAMRYDAQISRNDQYSQNVDAATSQLNFADSTLNSVNQVMSRARSLAVQAATGSMSQDALNATASEIDQLKQQLVNLGNTQFNGHYIFNGQLVDQQPYDPTNAATQSTDNTLINYQVSEGVTIPVNVTGQSVFGDPATAATMSTSDNAFAILDQLKSDMLSNNQTGVQSSLSKIDSRTSKLQSAWSEVGALGNRVDLVSNRLKELDTNLNDLLSKTEDTDIPQTITDMQMAENVQRASLAVGSRVIQPTLVDFLR